MWALERVGLAARAHVASSALSHGERQWLEIAMLLLLDEPTEGTLPNIVEEIEAVIGSLRGKMTILLVEQFLGFALANANHYYVMERGSVTISGRLGTSMRRDFREALGV